MFPTTLQHISSINYKTGGNGIRSPEEILKSMFLTYYYILIFIFYTDFFLHEATPQQDCIFHDVINRRSLSLIQQCMTQGSRWHTGGPDAHFALHGKYGGWGQRSPPFRGKAVPKLSFLWLPPHSIMDSNFPGATKSLRAGLLASQKNLI